MHRISLDSVGGDPANIMLSKNRSISCTTKKIEQNAIDDWQIAVLPNTTNVFG